MQYQLRISGLHHEQLRKHLLPGDGKEAIAVALCGRFSNERVTMLLVHELLLIPHSECVRKPDLIQWPTERVAPLLEKAMKKDLGILKIHSHPGWYNQFSSIDDISDEEFFTSVFGWVDGNDPHASAVMLPNGEIFGRVFFPNLSSTILSKVSIAGNQVISWGSQTKVRVDEMSKRTAQLFGDGTYQALRSLRIGVVGCSGTGSIVIEQLNRFAVGGLVLVDPDPIEEKNVNRIINARKSHAVDGVLKVDLFKETIDQTGFETDVKIYPVNLFDSLEAINELISCDVLIGCMDSADGRDLLNKISTFYLIPYLDMGINIESDGKGGINKIEGSVHFIQPGLSSLISRGVYTLEDIKAESILRKNPEEYARLISAERKNGHKYIKDVKVERPAVISINMQIASIAVNELLNRIHHFKFSDLHETAKISVDITDNFIVAEKEEDFKVDDFLAKRIGRGNLSPMLESFEIPETLKIDGMVKL